MNVLDHMLVPSTITFTFVLFSHQAAIASLHPVISVISHINVNNSGNVSYSMLKHKKPHKEQHDNQLQNHQM